jgi:sugar transferase (PEP-CTERM/EpsH1 system associated)
MNASDDSRPLILHVLHHLVIGGMENGMVNLINQLPQQRYRHMVACIEDYSDFRNRIQRPDVEVHALRRSRVGAWGVRRQIFELCRRHRPRVVHSRGLSGLDALWAARLAGVGHAVHSEHGYDVDNLHGEAWKPAMLRRLHRPVIDQFVTVSLDLQRFLQQRVGVPSRRITQIYNGVDTARFSPLDVRADLPGAPEGFITPQSVVIGTVGRLQPVKNQAMLLDATAQLLRQHEALRPRLRLVLVGDGPLQGALHEQVAALGLQDVVWLAGSSSRVVEFLHGFDAFVLPSLNEGISNTVLEAMACGLPVLATAVGGNVEIVRDGVVGQLLPSRDVQALAAAMLALLEQPEQRRSWGAAARQEALERFSMDRMLAAYAKVYDGWQRERADITGERTAIK